MHRNFCKILLKLRNSEFSARTGTTRTAGRRPKSRPSGTSAFTLGLRWFCFFFIFIFNIITIGYCRLSINWWKWKMPHFYTRKNKQVCIITDFVKEIIEEKSKVYYFLFSLNGRKFTVRYQHWRTLTAFYYSHILKLMQKFHLSKIRYLKTYTILRLLVFLQINFARWFLYAKQNYSVCD